MLAKSLAVMVCCVGLFARPLWAQKQPQQVLQPQVALPQEAPRPSNERENQEVFLNYRLQNCLDDVCRGHVQFLLDLWRSGISLSEGTNYYEIWPENGMGPPQIILLENNKATLASLHSSEEVEVLQELPSGPLNEYSSSTVDDFLIEIFPAQHEGSLDEQLWIGVPEALVGFVISPYARHKMGHLIQHFLYYRQSNRHITATQKQLTKVQREKDALLRKKAQSPNLSQKELDNMAHRVDQLEDKKRGIEKTLQIKSRERNRIRQKKKTLGPGVELRSRIGRRLYRVLRVSSYLSVSLVAFEVATRLYVWHVVERDPGPMPSLHVGNQMRKKAWGHFLKNYWAEREKKLTKSTADTRP